MSRRSQIADRRKLISAPEISPDGCTSELDEDNSSDDPFLASGSLDDESRTGAGPNRIACGTDDGCIDGSGSLASDIF